MRPALGTSGSWRFAHRQRVRWIAVLASFAAVLGTAWIEAPTVSAGTAGIRTYNPALTTTPPMGWNGFYGMWARVNETSVRQQARALVTSGMADAGYQYVNLDSGWVRARRRPNGRLVASSSRFPHGIRPVADYVHSLGLKFGIYTDIGSALCGYAGNSRALAPEDQALRAKWWARGRRFVVDNGLFGRGVNHIVSDVAQMRRWGVDYVKVDSCSTGYDKQKRYGTGRGYDQMVAGLTRRYRLFGQALSSPGRQMVYSICVSAEWRHPSAWAAGLGNLWRTTSDMMAYSRNTFRGGLLHQLALSQPSKVTEGRWGDADIMHIGVPPRVTDAVGVLHRTPDHYLGGGKLAKAQMGIWAMMASPMIASNDLRRMDPRTKALLLDDAPIGIDQDPLGRAATAEVGTAYTPSSVWSRPLADGDVAVMLVNNSNKRRTLSVATGVVGLGGSVIGTDAYSQAPVSFRSTITAEVPADMVAIYRLHDAA